MGNFVISLDFELMWGLRDHRTIAQYGNNVLGARDAIPRMLALFEKEAINATWATVGLLFCKTRDDMFDLAKSIRKPAYGNPRLSNYTYLPEIGKNEKEDQFHFGSSLISQIRDTCGQEIGTHTFSHYYCLEDGADAASFESDLDAAIDVARRERLSLRSIVFPRNQYDAGFLQSCASRGITSYRGNPTGYAYRSHSGAENTKLRRGLRLLDAYTGVLNRTTAPPAPVHTEITNVPASRFLRPNAGRLSRLHGAHVSTILREMRRAARTGLDYHLWWHPHNFGVGTDANMAALGLIIDGYKRLRDDFGFQSRTMEQVTP